jgi:beta-1,4-mannooligosaccharide/beta-1,4-mannosyl-N-acetylglucosamine phosphorylase
MTLVVRAEPLPNIPWQERPQGSNELLWRYSKNPVIGRSPFYAANSVFNSAVVPYKGRFAGVFRCDDRRRHMDIHAGFSTDGLSWNIKDRAIDFVCEDPEVKNVNYKYDPRVTPIEGRYYVSWCSGYNGPTIGLGVTDDFETFHQFEHAFLPFNRNGVLFPRRIGKNYAMLSRPSDNGHTPFGEIFYSESPDLMYWGRHRHVMRPENGWESTKIGPGPVPIETSEGWLLIYHGVLTSCNGFVYSFSTALLDLDQPWKVIARSRSYILNPREIYEIAGDVPNVVFPCAVLVDPPTDRCAIYYGAADTVTGLAFGKVTDLVEHARQGR